MYTVKVCVVVCPCVSVAVSVVELIPVPDTSVPDSVAEAFVPEHVVEDSVKFLSVPVLGLVHESVGHVVSELSPAVIVKLTWTPLLASLYEDGLVKPAEPRRARSTSGLWFGSRSSRPGMKGTPLPPHPPRASPANCLSRYRCP